MFPPLPDTPISPSQDWSRFPTQTGPNSKPRSSYIYIYYVWKPRKLTELQQNITKLVKRRFALWHCRQDDSVIIIVSLGKIDPKLTLMQVLSSSRFFCSYFATSSQSFSFRATLCLVYLLWLLILQRPPYGNNVFFFLWNNYIKNLDLSLFCRKSPHFSFL